MNTYHVLRNNWQPTASLETIQFKARLLQNIRAFFAQRAVLEVDTPILSRAAITDPNLHSFSTQFIDQTLYMHTSPEFFMKRLLAAGSGDIYQVCKVFRDDELGSRHNPEFTMLEWYRQSIDDLQLIDEIEQLFQYLVDILAPELSLASSTRLSYQQAFQQTLNIDPLNADVPALKQCAIDQGIEIPAGMSETDKDNWLDWLVTQVVAPSFSKQALTYLYHYPASQAALAKVNPQHPEVAHRFEVFYGELELANGFYELTDAELQAQRFNAENQLREKNDQPLMPVDKQLLEALRHGLPTCSGVAIGLDRLLMVLLNKNNIEDVLTFSMKNV